MLNGIVGVYIGFKEVAVLAVSGAVLKPLLGPVLVSRSASKKTELMQTISAKTGMIWFSKAMFVSYRSIVKRNCSIED